MPKHKAGNKRSTEQKPSGGGPVTSGKKSKAAGSGIAHLTCDQMKNAYSKDPRID